MKYTFRLIMMVTILNLTSCKKEDRFIANNNVPNYYGVSTIKVKNYINRLYIDLIGREPLDIEMDSLVNILKMPPRKVNLPWIGWLDLPFNIIKILSCLKNPIKSPIRKT